MEQCSNQDLCVSDPSVKYHSFICDMFSLIILCYHSIIVTLQSLIKQLYYFSYHRPILANCALTFIDALVGMHTTHIENAFLK
jgi:hypothetical protein